MISDSGAMEMEKAGEGKEEEGGTQKVSLHQGGLVEKKDSRIEASRPGGTSGNNTNIYRKEF